MSSIPLTAVKSSDGTVLFQAIPSQSSFSSGSAVSATLSTLYYGTADLQLPVIALLSPLTTVISPKVQEYLIALTLSANAAANSMACGSMLAGQTSETDEYGDLAFWLGEGQYGQGHEREVLDALRLHAVLGPHSKITPMETSSSTRLQTALDANSAARREETERLSALLSVLDDVYSFTVEPLLAGGGTVAYFLLGRCSGKISGWVGLVGIGVWS